MGSALLSLLLLGTLVLPETWAVSGSHSLKYFSTGWAGPEVGKPKFIAVGYVDDRQILRFDGDDSPDRVEWIKQAVRAQPEFWDQEMRIHRGHAQNSQVCLEALGAFYNQSQGGTHTYQYISGCEVSPDGRFQRGFYQTAYDGEDYITLDTETWTWRPWVHRAEKTKSYWEATREAERQKVYLEEECVMWLQKYLKMGLGALTRTDPPSARVTRHTTPHGEGTLRCRVQDFYPAEISLTWLRDGEELLQDIEFIETRPGGDGTFQKWAAVKVPRGQEGRYICRIQHEGLAEPLTLKWEHPSSSTGIAVRVLAGVLLLLTAIIPGAVIWRKKNSGGTGGAYDLASTTGETLRVLEQEGGAVKHRGQSMSAWEEDLMGERHQQ
ncbi:class I histocompatibility antigen, Gogo-OKO alpha chain-like [Macrotis lagotis]|uniref:class I histocompatibility antigen, Gogo-OKO alpha chain-like n=1 Tax=Macrotis lagotis TaxID=92651 RepID=UPI003D69197E